MYVWMLLIACLVRYIVVYFLSVVMNLIGHTSVVDVVERHVFTIMSLCDLDSTMYSTNFSICGENA